MVAFLSEEIEHFQKRIVFEPQQHEPDWKSIAELAAELSAMAVHLLHRIEATAAREQPADRKLWDETAARKFIPLFQQWYGYARAVQEIRRDCKAHGFPVEGASEFLHALNISKMMAIDFDSAVESLRRIERGESVGRLLKQGEG